MTETPAPDLRALRELAEAATPGPWSVSSQYGLVDVYRWPYNPGDDMVAERVDAHDATFIAAANPAAVLALIERVEAAEAAVARVLALVDEVTATFDADLRNPHTERAAGLAAGAQALADDIRDALDAD